MSGGIVSYAGGDSSRLVAEYGQLYFAVVAARRDGPTAEDMERFGPGDGQSVFIKMERALAELGERLALMGIGLGASTATMDPATVDAFIRAMHAQGSGVPGDRVAAIVADARVRLEGGQR